MGLRALLAAQLQQAEAPLQGLRILGGTQKEFGLTVVMKNSILILLLVVKGFALRLGLAHRGLTCV